MIKFTTIAKNPKGDCYSLFIHPNGKEQLVWFLHNHPVVTCSSKIIGFLGDVKAEKYQGLSFLKETFDFESVYKGEGKIIFKALDGNIYVLFSESAKADIAVSTRYFLCRDCKLQKTQLTSEFMSLKGTGHIVLQVPFPASEMCTINVQNDTLRVYTKALVSFDNAFEFTIEDEWTILTGSGSILFIMTYLDEYSSIYE